MGAGLQEGGSLGGCYRAEGATANWSTRRFLLKLDCYILMIGSFDSPEHADSSDTSFHWKS